MTTDEWCREVQNRFERARWVDPDRIACDSCRAFVWQPIRQLAGEMSWQDRLGGGASSKHFREDQPRYRRRLSATDKEIRAWVRENVDGWTRDVERYRPGPERRRAHLWRCLRELLPLRRPRITLEVPRGVPADIGEAGLLLPWRSAVRKLRRPGYKVSTRVIVPDEETLDLALAFNKRTVFGPVLAMQRAGLCEARRSRKRKRVYRRQENAGILQAVVTWPLAPVVSTAGGDADVVEALKPENRERLATTYLDRHSISYALGVH